MKLDKSKLHKKVIRKYLSPRALRKKSDNHSIIDIGSRGNSKLSIKIKNYKKVFYLKKVLIFHKFIKVDNRNQ